MCQPGTEKKEFSQAISIGETCLNIALFYQKPDWFTNSTLILSVVTFPFSMRGSIKKFVLSKQADMKYCMSFLVVENVKILNVTVCRWRHEFGV